jgi:hypothetical protein
MIITFAEIVTGVIVALAVRESLLTWRYYIWRMLASLRGSIITFRLARACTIRAPCLHVRSVHYI